MIGREALFTSAGSGGILFIASMTVLSGANIEVFRSKTKSMESIDYKNADQNEPLIRIAFIDIPNLGQRMK